MKKWLSEFKEFAVKGNVLDMAVGVVVGSAFSKIVTSIVNDIIMPLIGGIFGGHDFTSLVWKIGNSEVKYGSLIQNIVDFLIIAGSIFLFIKLINTLIPKKEPVPVVEEEPKKPDDIVLLEEISATLKEIKENR